MQSIPRQPDNQPPSDTFVAVENQRVNGEHWADLLVGNIHNGAVRRGLRISDPGECDQFISDVESKLGADAAGIVKSKIDRAITEASQAESSGIRIISAGKLVDDYPEERPPLIHGVCRLGETLNIVASPKTYKSYLALMVSLCVCSGRPLFDLFPTEKRRVLYLDNELHKETFSHRIPRVAASLSITGDEWRDSLDVVSLRGHLADIDQLNLFFRSIEPGKYGLIILDALYRLWPEGCDENSNSDVVKVYNRLDLYAEMTGAAIIVIHHASKGIQGGKSVTDTGSGAGSQSRAPDGHIVIRQHEEPGCAVLEAVLRSHAPMAPLGLRWVYPKWIVDPLLDVAKLKRERGPGGRPRKERAEKPEPIVWTPETFTERFVSDSPIRKDVLVSKANREGIALRVINGLIAEAEAAGIIHKHPMGATTGIGYATVKPTLFSGAKSEERARAQPPVPPTGKRRSKPPLP